MSKVHLARSGFITKAALPSITRQRGTTTGTSNLMLFGAGKTTVANNTTFIDSSSNAFTVTRAGDTVHSGHNPFSTVSDGSAYFDGTNDYLTVASNTAFDLGSGNFTIEAWVYQTSYSSATAPIVGRWSASGSRSYRLDVSSTGALVFNWNDSNSLTSSSSAVPINQWSHVAVTRNGSTLTLFVNGAVVASGTISVSIGQSATFLTVGINYEAFALSLSGWNILGYVSNLRIVVGTAVYTSAFTPPTSALTAITNTQLLLLTDNYSIVNSTSTVLPVTITGNSTISTAQYPTGMTRSIYFDGTGDVISIPDSTALNLSSGDFTVECWVYLNTTSGTQTVIYKGTNSTSVFGTHSIAIISGAATFLCTTSGSAYEVTINGGSLSTGQWYHLAFTRSGSSFRAFINGTQTGSTVTNANNLNTNAGTTLIGAGNPTGSVQNLNGYISNLRIVKGTAVYTANFTAPSAPLSVNISVPANVTNAIYGVNQLA